jgi:hypothetical protein
MALLEDGQARTGGAIWKSRLLTPRQENFYHLATIIKKGEQDEAEH